LTILDEKFRAQINGKLNDVSSAGENKLKKYFKSLYLKIIKKQNMYSSIENSEAVLVFESNNAGFKKVSSFI
jgi:hypothetical protein